MNSNKTSENLTIDLLLFYFLICLNLFLIYSIFILLQASKKVYFYACISIRPRSFTIKLRVFKQHQV